MTRRRKLLVAAALVLLAVGGCAVTVAGNTEFDQRDLAYYGRAGDPPTPAWTRPCRRVNRRLGRRYVLPCARVDGLVLHRQDEDPDGDRDVHAVVVADTRLVIVKTDSARGLAAPGRRLRMAGLRVSGRLGLPVVDARARLARRAP